MVLNSKFHSFLSYKYRNSLINTSIVVQLADASTQRCYALKLRVLVCWGVVLKDFQSEDLAIPTPFDEIQWRSVLFRSTFRTAVVKMAGWSLLHYFWKLEIGPGSHLRFDQPTKCSYSRYTGRFTAYKPRAWQKRTSTARCQNRNRYRINY